MARLALMYGVVKKAHKFDLRKKRNERRLSRYMDTALGLDDEEFRANYRVSKDLFGDICNELKGLLPPTKRRSDIPLKLKVICVCRTQTS